MADPGLEQINNADGVLDTSEKRLLKKMSEKLDKRNVGEIFDLQQKLGQKFLTKENKINPELIKSPEDIASFKLYLKLKFQKESNISLDIKIDEDFDCLEPYLKILKLCPDFQEYQNDFLIADLLTNPNAYTSVLDSLSGKSQKYSYDDMIQALNPIYTKNQKIRNQNLIQKVLKANNFDDIFDDDLSKISGVDQNTYLIDIDVQNLDDTKKRNIIEKLEQSSQFKDILSVFNNPANFNLGRQSNDIVLNPNQISLIQFYLQLKGLPDLQITGSFEQQEDLYSLFALINVIEYSIKKGEKIEDLDMPDIMGSEFKTRFLDNPALMQEVCNNIDAYNKFFKEVIFSHEFRRSDTYQKMVGYDLLQYVAKKGQIKEFVSKNDGEKKDKSKEEIAEGLVVDFAKDKCNQSAKKLLKDKFGIGEEKLKGLEIMEYSKDKEIYQKNDVEKYKARDDILNKMINDDTYDVFSIADFLYSNFQNQELDYYIEEIVVEMIQKQRPEITGSIAFQKFMKLSDNPSQFEILLKSSKIMNIMDFSKSEISFDMFMDLEGLVQDYQNTNDESQKAKIHNQIKQIIGRLNFMDREELKDNGPAQLGLEQVGNVDFYRTVLDDILAPIKNTDQVVYKNIKMYIESVISNNKLIFGHMMREVFRNLLGDNVFDTILENAKGVAKNKDLLADINAEFKEKDKQKMNKIIYMISREIMNMGLTDMKQIQIFFYRLLDKHLAKEFANNDKNDDKKQLIIKLFSPENMTAQEFLQTMNIMGNAHKMIQEFRTSMQTDLDLFVHTDLADRNFDSSQIDIFNIVKMKVRRQHMKIEDSNMQQSVLFSLAKRDVMRNMKYQEAKLIIPRVFQLDSKNYENNMHEFDQIRGQYINMMFGSNEQQFVNMDLESLVKDVQDTKKRQVFLEILQEFHKENLQYIQKIDKNIWEKRQKDIKEVFEYLENPVVQKYLYEGAQNYQQSVKQIDDFISITDNALDTLAAGGAEANALRAQYQSVDVQEILESQDVSYDLKSGKKQSDNNEELDTGIVINDQKQLTPEQKQLNIPEQIVYDQHKAIIKQDANTEQVIEATSKTKLNKELISWYLNKNSFDIHRIVGSVDDFIKYMGINLNDDFTTSHFDRITDVMSMYLIHKLEQSSSQIKDEALKDKFRQIHRKLVFDSKVGFKNFWNFMDDIGGSMEEFSSVWGMFDFFAESGSSTRDFHITQLDEVMSGTNRVNQIYIDKFFWDKRNELASKDATQALS